MALPLPLITADSHAEVLARVWADLAAFRPLEDQAAAAPGLIVTLPTAWANKYQILLYGAAAAHGHGVVGVRSVADLARISWPGPVILHAHWFASSFHGVSSEAEATQRLVALQAMIEAFRARTGARLLWTAHNLFPHGNPFPKTYLALRRWIFETFDAVHLMQPHHADLLTGAIGLAPPNPFVVPHMTYRGAVYDHIDRAQARARFGLPGDALVFGLFGSIQRYKQIPLFLEVLDRIVADTPRPVAAVIGGIATDPVAAGELVARWGRTAHVRLELRDIPDHEIQYFHHAADAMVLPYAETLNSGAALMAASFGKPWLMPAGDNQRALAHAGAIGFDAGREGGLETALRAFADGPPPAPPGAQALSDLDPATVSAAFFKALGAMPRAGAQGGAQGG